MLDRNRPIQTSDGREVTIYGNEYIHGVIKGRTFPSVWYSDGTSATLGTPNLVNVPKIERYIYVFRDGRTITLRKPKNWRYDKPLACKHIFLDIEEGQFDE